MRRIENGIINPDFYERLKKSLTLLVDLDGSLFPAPLELESCLEFLSKSMTIIPCTTRSWGEMITEEYPGKKVLLKTSFGIYEAGLVIKTSERLQVLCKKDEITKLRELKDLIENSLKRVGPRNPNNRYELANDPNNPWAWSYLSSCLGEEYVRTNFVPLIIPPYPEQFSLVIWPSGSGRDCPSGRFFYQICLFLDGLKVGRPELFENMSILISDESVIVRPNSPDGNPITKLTGVKYLEKDGFINPNKTLFIGDDDWLDLAVARYIRNAGGITIVPSTAGPGIKTIADFITPGKAGEAILPILSEIARIKND